MKKTMSYDKGKAEYYEEESSGTKPYLMNTRALAKPFIPTNVITSANFRLNWRMNNASHSMMRTDGRAHV